MSEQGEIREFIVRYHNISLHLTTSEADELKGILDRALSKSIVIGGVKHWTYRRPIYSAILNFFQTLFVPETGIYTVKDKIGAETEQLLEELGVAAPPKKRGRPKKENNG